MIFTEGQKHIVNNFIVNKRITFHYSLQLTNPLFKIMTIFTIC